MENSQNGHTAMYKSNNNNNNNKRFRQVLANKQHWNNDKNTLSDKYQTYGRHSYAYINCSCHRHVPPQAIIDKRPANSAYTQMEEHHL